MALLKIYRTYMGAKEATLLQKCYCRISFCMGKRSWYFMGKCGLDGGVVSFKLSLRATFTRFFFHAQT